MFVYQAWILQWMEKILVHLSRKIFTIVLV